MNTIFTGNTLFSSNVILVSRSTFFQEMKSMREFDFEPFGVNGAVVAGKLDLTFHTKLKRYKVVNADAKHVANIFGCLVERHIKHGSVTADSTVTSDFPIHSTDDLERFVTGLNGSFIVESLSPLPHRLYPDAGGTIPIVYCPSSGRLASSAGMMMNPAEYEERFLRDRYNRLIGNEISGAWIPGFLTAHEGLWRLLPNFFLDLQTWEVRRFWPKKENIHATISVEDAGQSVAADLRGYVNAVAAQFPTIANTLTAGFDTRIILSASRDVCEQCEFFTFGTKDHGLDPVVAEKIARKLGLKHRFLEPVLSSEKDKEQWDILVGHSTHEVNRNLYKTLSLLTSDVMLTGMYGETGRSRLYQKELDRIEKASITDRFVAGRISAPMDDAEVVATLNAWLKTIDWAPNWKILDLAFNELRFGGWAMAQATAARGVQFTLIPFAQYSVQEAFMNVRPSEKTTSELFHRIGTLLWPEAMEFSINKFDDYRDQVKILKKLTSRTHLTRGWRLLKTKLR